MHWLNELAVAWADSPLVLVLLLALCIVDGFFPPVPSESIVIALASLAASGKAESLWFIVPIAAVGAFVGDTIAYHIGRWIPLDRVPFARSERGQRMIHAAGRSLDKRGTVYILAARFVPVGRIAVNFSAGAVKYPRSRFIPAAAIAGIMWATYSALIGLGAGALVGKNPLIGVIIGVGSGIILGYAVDKLMGYIARRRFDKMTEDLAEEDKK